MDTPATATDRPLQRTVLIASELQCYDIDVCALNEIHLLDEESLAETSAGYTFFWKGLAPDEQQIHGVDFMI